MARRHLVTGATGFVGSAIVLELLEHTDARVACLVRPGRNGEAPDARLTGALLHAAEAANRPHLGRSIRRRCRAIPGDLIKPNWGVHPRGVGEIDEVWHSAASLNFEDESRDKIHRHNVEGTCNTLELARALGQPMFNYISTAYVSGTRTGRIMEEIPLRDPDANNYYEQSKMEAERRVANSGLPYRILRPSIVVGHSETGASSSDTGFYGYLQRVLQLVQHLRSRDDMHLLEKLQVAGNPDARLNLVPVDIVASSAVGISLSRSAARVFHLTLESAPTIALAEETVYEVLGLPGPRIVHQPTHRSAYDSLLDEGMRFYRSYISSSREFDRSNTAAAIGDTALRAPMGPTELAHYARRFMEAVHNLA